VSYQAKLPELFPFCAAIEASAVADLIAILVAPDESHPNGSSFAVTVDTDESMRCLWLSKASAERLGL
jgi:hypothetical protein